MTPADGYPGSGSGVEMAPATRLVVYTDGSVGLLRVIVGEGVNATVGVVESNVLKDVLDSTDSVIVGPGDMGSGSGVVDGVVDL